MKKYSLVSFLFAQLLKEKTASKVFVLNAGKLHIIFNSLKKTDKEDALQIARLLARVPEEQLPSVHIPETHEMEERSCVAENRRLQRMITQSINAWHNLLRNNDITDVKRKHLINAEHRLSHIQLELLCTLHKKQVLFFDPSLENNTSNAVKKLKKYELVDESFSLNLLFSGQKT